MSTRKRITLTSIASLGLLSLIVLYFILHFIISDNLIAFKALDLLIVLGQLIGLACIYSTTAIKSLMLKRLNIIGAISFLVGIVMIITHISAFALVISTIFIIAISIYQFIKLDSKSLLNYLKLVWFILFLIGVVFKMNHFPGAFNILFGSSVVIWLIIINYSYNFENNRLAKRPQ